MTVLDRLLDRSGARTDEVLGRRGRVALVLVFCGLAVAGPVIDVIATFWLHVLTRVMIFALFAISLDLVFGYTGLPSFGHAAMFGVGGYTVAFVTLGPTQNLLVTIATAALASATVALLIGWLSVRGTGLFFAFLTLAFAQVLYLVAFNDLPAQLLGADKITGGDNGLVGIPGYELFGVEFGGLFEYYYLTLVVVGICVALLIRIANSEFGRVLQGIRENEDRLTALGYDVTRYKVIAFTVSGTFTGVAGALYAPLVRIAHPSQLFWLTSADGIIMILVGGIGTLWGPMVGAAFITVFEEFATVVGNWHLYLGVLFVTMVIFLPGGIAGAISTVARSPREALSNARRAGRRYVRRVRGDRH
ncbi:branched-chain amino acid ABC transporter permease [Halobacteriales archaeon QS_1_68_20]|nr:MAG: branched-chain amino acid ABC transporter permease [Halobacteriales archaeon QS_1_68_20]